MRYHLPRPHQVQVRLFSLDRDENELAELRHLLAPDELERAERLFSPHLRNRFIAGRGLLRKTVSACLDLDPAGLRLTSNQHGKPLLSTEHQDSGLKFNISHCGNHAILAISGQCDVGVDLEQIRADLPFKAMAEQFFSLREQAELFSLPDEQQLPAFYRCWTRKEAYLKGCGSGFSHPCNSCDVSLLPGQPAALLADRSEPERPAGWKLFDLDVTKGFCAALAIAHPTPEICQLPPD